MFHFDTDLYSQRNTPLNSTKDFFHNTLSKLGWKTAKQEVVLDIGCGTGMVTTQLVLPFFPRSKKIIGMDLTPNMIEHAKKNEHHPKIEYRVANIEDWSTLEQWKGEITRIVSTFCFQWVKNQKEGLKNVYELLSPGGEAGLYFILQSWYYEAVLEISKDPKWSEFLKDVDNQIPVSHLRKYDASHYKSMLEEIGFTIVHMEVHLRKDPYPTDQVYKDFFSSICAFIPCIPPDRIEEFKNDLLQYCVKHNGRNSEGLPTHNGNNLELVVRK